MSVAVTIAGTVYEGWTAAKVVRSMESIAGTFELTLADRWAEEMAARPIAPEDPVRVALDGETVITGHVDDVEPSYDGKRHQVTVRGRDAAGALVDCSAVVPSGEFRNVGLAALAEALAKPFAVPVAAAVDTGAPFKTFAIQEGETAFEAIARACRYRAVLPVSDGQGGIVLTRAGAARSAGVIERGVNVLAAAGAYSGRDRYSEYIVKGSQSGGKLFAAATAAGPTATVYDRSVRRHRPLLVVADQQVDIAAARERGAWESRVRAGRARRCAYTLAGWRTGDGELWRINTLVTVRDSWQRIEGEALVAAVEFSHGGDGTLSRLTVVPPNAFIRMKESEETDKKGFGW